MGYQQKHKEYIYRHMYPMETSRHFTYHKHPDGKGGFLDNGICELCGARGTYTLIAEEKPRCCYKCYSKLRQSKGAAFDVAGLQNARYISLAEAKKIVKSYSDLKTAVSNQEEALGLLGLLFGGKRR